MAIQVVWTPNRVQEFIRCADLDGIEREIISMRHRRYGRVKDIMALREKGYYISVEAYDAIIKNLKFKYDQVCRNSEYLPPRQKNKSDAYLVSGKFKA